MISVKNVTKMYGRYCAVDNISFNLVEGDIVGFLGPNGAGKTTTMRLIAGCLLPNCGNVYIDGQEITSGSREARRLVGYLPEMVPLYTDMTTRKYLEYLCSLRGLDRRQVNIKVEEVIDTCELKEYADTILRKLSKGFKQRVGLAQAIIHEPKVLILDEPTIGIDPIQVIHTRELIRGLGKKHTILLSSHIISEVRMICERFIIIHQGHIVGEDYIDTLSSITNNEKRIRIRVNGPVTEVTHCIQEIPGIQKVEYKHPYHYIDFLSNFEPQAHIAKVIVQSGMKLMAMENIETDLESIFIYLTKGEATHKK